MYQEFCQDSQAIKTINSPESQIWMDTGTPYSLLNTKVISNTSTYPALSGSSKVIHSLHRCIRWCMWSTTLTRIWWDGISNSLSFAYLHGYTEKMEYHRTRSRQSILCSYKMELLPPGSWSHCTQWPQTTGKISKWKNANNKVNRWGLELAIYNITFEWILGAWNKAADCLSRLVEQLHDRQATVQMLTATNQDRPAFHTRSRTAQHIITEYLTPQPKTDTVTPGITTSQTHLMPCQNH